MRRFFFALLLFFAVAAPAAAGSVFFEDFEGGLRSVWQEKVFVGKTLYRVVPEGEGHCLKAESRGTASALVCRQEYDVKAFSVLSWRWKVEKTLAKGDGRKKEGDDYAGRLYVIFPHWFFPKTRTINYIWANRLPVGEFFPSPYTSNSMMVAVRSGGGDAGSWVEERRNVYEDYRMIFGEEPPAAGVIAIMTDTDNTRESAVAYYDDIRVEAGPR